MVKQIFEVEFVDRDAGFPERLIGECIVSGKHIIGRIKIKELQPGRYGEKLSHWGDQ